MNITVCRIPFTIPRDFHVHRVLPCRASTRTHLRVRTPRVHACARHRQVLSNRRVLSIINVYRMRNRVQARPRYHPPLSARPSSAVHLRCWPVPSITLLLARFCAALSFCAEQKRFHENLPPLPTSFPSRKRGCRSACR